jgi:hypothetical protein
VNVRIWPEQLNPMDPSAIDLDYMEQDGHVFGYILLLNYASTDLHALVAAGDILEVYVQHIKYRVDFFKIGFYPKVS